MKNKKIILWSSVAVLVAGAVYLLTRKKDAKAIDATPKGGDMPSQPTPRGGVVPAKPITPKKVVIEKSGTNVYAENDGKIGKVTRYSKSNNETAGNFIGYRTINQNVYVLFSDSYNSGIRSLVLKSLTNYKAN
jgi:hypothetical protein